MPFTIPNAADAGNTNQAEPDKVDFDIITAGSTQTGVVSGCAVTPTTLLTLDVAAGVVAVLGVVATVTSGTVVVGTADVTNPRFDLVVVNSSGTKSVTAGTAAAEPVYPAVPASSVCLAAVYVPALLATILATHIIDKRVIVIPSVPKSLYDANTIVIATADDTPISLTVAASRILGRKATGDIGALTAAEVLAILVGAMDTSWAPTITSQTGTITTVGTVATGFKVLDKIVLWRADITITNNGTGATFLKMSSVPSGTPVATKMAMGYGVNDDTGVMLAAYYDGGTFLVRTATGAYPVASAQNVVLAGFYEIA